MVHGNGYLMNGLRDRAFKNGILMHHIQFLNKYTRIFNMKHTFFNSDSFIKTSADSNYRIVRILFAVAKFIVRILVEHLAE